MPGEIIELDQQQYPDFEGKKEGDKINFSVAGTITGIEDGKLQVTTDEVRATDVNPADRALREQSRQPNLRQPAEEAV